MINNLPAGVRVKDQLKKGLDLDDSSLTLYSFRYIVIKFNEAYKAFDS